MGELVKMSEQFGALPMDSLIGAPLTAACDAQVRLASATSDFIETVGFVKGEGENAPSKVRMVDFEYQKPEQIDGKMVPTDYKVSIPFISIVSVPTLQVTDVDVNFMMEVKSSFSEQTSEASEGTINTEASVGFGPFSMKVSASGSISSSKDTQRQSDNSAKYDVSLKARQSGTPEGLSRVLDILQQTIVPVKKEAEATSAT